MEWRMTMTSSTPCLSRLSRTWWITGRLTTGTIGLGVSYVRGRSRVPAPAASSIARFGIILVRPEARRDPLLRRVEQALRALGLVAFRVNPHQGLGARRAHEQPVAVLEDDLQAVCLDQVLD